MAKATKAGKDEAAADPNKLVRDRAGAYRSADGRFTVESEASGAWFVVDNEQQDELGMARVLGPFPTLQGARDAVSEARTAPPVRSLLAERVKREAGRARREPAQKPEPPPKPRPIRIRYATSLDGIEPRHLNGFFEGWPNAPSARTHLRILEAADEVVLAVDAETNNVVGFVTALTDRVLAAYIPLLEVLPAHRRKGIGTELLRRMLLRLGDLYMVDLTCDDDLDRFYKRFGLKKGTAMSLRRQKLS